ncbi:Clp protease N-terminal domain-containing protein [Streptococcus suis]
MNKQKSKQLEPEHIMLAIIEEKDGLAALVFEALEVDAQSVKEELQKATKRAVHI